MFHTLLENNLPNGIDSIPPISSSNEIPLDLVHGVSAPTQSVYINMGKQTGDVNFVRPIATADPPLLPPYVDHQLPSRTIERHSHHHHHHHRHTSHYSQNRNRYPYVPFYDQRSASRRSTPSAPSMPEHLSASYTQDRTITLRNGNSGSYNRNKIEEEEDQQPSKSFWIILRLIFFVLAIECMESIETALTVPILTSLHVDESYYSMAWLISPIIGFFFQPIVGLWSDTCKCRWGRRRPFILVFAIGIYIGIVLLLNSSDLGSLFGDHIEPHAEHEIIPIRAVIITAVGVTLIDFCTDTANSPLRAYLIDVTNQLDQERGFNLHAILGLGGCLGFGIGTISWKHVPMFKKDGGEFSMIFYIATFVFFVCTISTLTSVREEPLRSSSSRNNGDIESSSDDEDDDDERVEVEMDERRPLLLSRRNNSQSFNSSNKQNRSKSNKYFSKLNKQKQEGFVEIDAATGVRVPYDHVDEGTHEGILLKTFENAHEIEPEQISTSNSFNHSTIETQEFNTELQKKAKLVKLGFMRRSKFDNDDNDNDNVTIKSMLVSMVKIPSQLWRLMICQVIGFVGYFSTHLYFTDFMAIEIYNGTMEHEDDDAAIARYRLGVTMGCWGLFVFAASSAIYAFCLERWLANRFPLKMLYFIGYFIYVIGCIVNFFFHHVAVNIAMCFTFGILIVSLNTLPYQMLSQFHSDPTYRNRDGSKRGIGIDCALLNSCRFLGELIVAASLGPLLKETGVNYCMVFAAGFSLIGNILVFFLFYFKN